jgi:hypothetical protein
MTTDSPIDLQAAVSPDTVAPQLKKLQSSALIAAVLGLALTVIGALAGLDKFFQSYLLAYLFWFGVTAGSIGFLLLHNTVGGGWGFIIRRGLESGSRTLPVMALLFLPIAYAAFMGDKSMYEWAHSSVVANDAVLRQKEAYLNPQFFAVRAVVYFVIWGVLTYLLNKWSRVFDERNDPATLEKLNKVGAFGILIHVLLVTFMSVDWAMSLAPHWFSSIYGFLFLAGQALSTLALMNLILGTLGQANPLIRIVPDRYFRDLGNLMMAIVLVWSYCSFSQYLIQYSGNIAEDVGWYTLRRHGGWGIIGLMLVFLHFALPFAVLLASIMKTKPRNLAKIAAFLLFMRVVDLLYLTRPTFSETLVGGLYLADLGLLLLMGGIWMWLWAEQMKKQPLVPLHDPRFSYHWELFEYERAHGHDEDHAHDEHTHGEHTHVHGAEVKAHV